MSEELFQFSIRISLKARNPRLKITLRDGLEIILPKGYDPKKIPAILSKKKRWIKAAFERVESHRKYFETEPEWHLPESIVLPGISQEWRLELKETTLKTVTVRERAQNRLIVSGPIKNAKACIVGLRRWLLRRAKGSLVPLLQNVSKKTGLSFTRVSIRYQKTRWGSCSRKRTISLNAQLLFLEPALIDYCMTHELCHIKEMNHSKNFWSLVESHLPDYRHHDRRLRKAWQTLPRWTHHLFDNTE
jgi:predicted metal-dependent hydrolase